MNEKAENVKSGGVFKKVASVEGPPLKKGEYSQDCFLLGGIAIIAIDPILDTSQEESSICTLTQCLTYIPHLIIYQKNFWKNKKGRAEYVHNNVFHGWLPR